MKKYLFLLPILLFTHLANASVTSASVTGFTNQGDTSTTLYTPLLSTITWDYTVNDSDAVYAIVYSCYLDCSYPSHQVYSTGDVTLLSGHGISTTNFNFASRQVMLYSAVILEDASHNYLREYPLASYYNNSFIVGANSTTQYIDYPNLDFLMIFGSFGITLFFIIWFFRKR